MAYKITLCNGVEIQGSFYEEELQKMKPDIFRMEKIIKQQGKRALINGWAIMIRLTRGFTTKTLTNYRIKIQCSPLRGLALTSFPEDHPL